MANANAKNNLIAVIDAGIAEIAKSEATTKATLSALSRNLLVYVPDSKDIGRVNRLLDVLTRNNEKVAAMYFANFLPWKLSKETNRFGEMIKSKNEQATKLANLAAWLDDETNDVWKWADRNVEITPRDKNYKAQITNLVDRALTANGKNERFKLNAVDVINSVIAGGVKLDDLMAVIGSAHAARDAANGNDEVTEEAEAVAE